MPAAVKSPTEGNSAAPRREQRKAARKALRQDTIHDRPVQYGEIKVSVCRESTGNPLTAAQAKALIGWQAEPEGVKFEGLYDLIDDNGTKVRLYNNLRNRPFNASLANTWKSEILNPGRDRDGNLTKTRWKLNGESLVIGRTGLTLSAQHRLVALILAAQAYEKSPERWPNWDSEPTMDCIIVFGIDEDDATVNTIDTGRPRSLSDVIYRSHYFAGKKDKVRVKIAKLCGNAVKLLEERTGANANVDHKLTHSDHLDFMERHPRLLDCINHIYEENGTGGESGNRKISKFISLGYAAGLMYLMGSAATQQETYYKSDKPSEESLDWQTWDKAKDFWTMLAGGAPGFKLVSKALGKITEDGGGGPSERCALIIKAWHLYLEDKEITLKGLQLKYHTDADDIRRLAESPTVGGIDRGVEGDDVLIEPDPSPDEIAERAAEIKDESKAKANGSKPAANDKLTVGDTVIVNDGDSPWTGELVSLAKGVASVRVASGFAGAGSIHHIKAAQVGRKVG